MSDVTKPPGGWLDADQIKIVRRALRADRRYHHGLARSSDQRAQTLAHDRNASVSALASARSVVVTFTQQAEATAAVLEVFAGIEHGARVEALPSPEEEAAHEAAYVAGAAPCACGHTAHWHGAGMRGMGSGCCEHDADCPCSEFVNA